jgi:FKBP-type peptidyl-prolyl cis-trans isomerase
MIKKYYQSVLLFLAVSLMITFGSCDPAKKYEKEEKDSIQNYLSQNGDKNFELKNSGLYYSEVVTGTGLTPVTHDSAWVKYTAMFLDGGIFDTNVGKADTLKYRVDEAQVISGFDEGITYMKVGGKATLLIPSKLAWGPAGLGIVPGYTAVLFDVELVRVKPESGK